MYLLKGIKLYKFVYFRFLFVFHIFRCTEYCFFNNSKPTICASVLSTPNCGFRWKIRQNWTNFKWFFSCLLFVSPFQMETNYYLWASDILIFVFDLFSLWWIKEKISNSFFTIPIDSLTICFDCGYISLREMYKFESRKLL